MRAEIQDMKQELSTVNMMDEFARYARLERKINKMTDKLKTHGTHLAVICNLAIRADQGGPWWMDLRCMCPRGPTVMRPVSCMQSTVTSSYLLVNICFLDLEIIIDFSSSSVDFHFQV